jgi:hypothetical protein
MMFHSHQSTGLTLSGWWLTYHSEKYESQLGRLFPTEWENNKHIPVTTNQLIGPDLFSA